MIVQFCLDDRDAQFVGFLLRIFDFFIEGS